MVRTKAITLKQLRALAAVEDAGSLTAAAQVLNVTTPAVSTQIKLLEANIGGALLNRGPNGQVNLTPAGREVLGATNRIERALISCAMRVSALRSGQTGQVDIGVVSTGKYFAPGLVKRAKDALPGVEFHLHVGNRDQIRAALEDESIDLAIMGRPPREPRVDAIPLADHPYILIAPPDHRLANKPNIRMKDLDGETFLCREQGSGSRILTDRFVERLSDVIWVNSMELGSNETIKQGVIAGLGVAIISGHTVAAELEAKRLIHLRMHGLPIVRQWYLVTPAGKTPAPAAFKFQEFLLNLGGDYLPDLSHYN